MKLRVVHTFGRNAGAVQEFDKPTVRFGRSPDNDVVFDPNYDRDASGHHAEARLEGASWILVDLQSKNGTLIGGRRVARHALSSGDEITFGAKGPRVRVDMVGAPPTSREALREGARPPHPAARPEQSAVRPRAPSAQLARPAVVGAPSYASPGPAAPPQGHAPPAAPAYAPLGPAAAPSGYAPAAAGPPPGYAAPPAAPPQGHAPAHAPPPQGYAPRAPAAPPPGQPPLAPAAGARVGQRTIAMMIQSAVASATGRSRPRKTQEIAAFVDQRVSAATAGQRRTAWILGSLIVLSLLALGGVILWGQRSEDEITRLRGQLAKLSPDDPRRKEIEGRLGTLHPSNANFGRNLYDRSRKGIFMLASSRGGFCTAFAVRPNVLATNAHCIVAAKKLGGPIVALENEGRGQIRFSVTEMRPHPAYRENDAQNLTPDVGVVTVSGRAAVVLEMATAQELAQAGAGDDVYLIGFPGRLMDAQNPAATFLAANIGRLTNASGRPGAFAETWLLQHDAATTQGTSGSPVFNGRGKVIAVNAGGYLEGDDETIAGKKTEVVKASPYKFAMRIDLLDTILR